MAMLWVYLLLCPWWVNPWTPAFVGILALYLWWNLYAHRWNCTKYDIAPFLFVESLFLWSFLNPKSIFIIFSSIFELLRKQKKNSPHEQSKSLQHSIESWLVTGFPVLGWLESPIYWVVSSPTPNYSSTKRGFVPLENHHLQWIDPFKMVIFHSKLLVITRGYIRLYPSIIPWSSPLNYRKNHMINSFLSIVIKPHTITTFHLKWNHKRDHSPYWPSSMVRSLVQVVTTCPDILLHIKPH